MLVVHRESPPSSSIHRRNQNKRRPQQSINELTKLQEVRFDLCICTQVRKVIGKDPLFRIPNRRKGPWISSFHIIFVRTSLSLFEEYVARSFSSCGSTIKLSPHYTSNKERPTSYVYINTPKPNFQKCVFLVYFLVMSWQHLLCRMHSYQVHY